MLQVNLLPDPIAPGRRVGKLTVVGPAEDKLDARGSPLHIVELRCDCGATVHRERAYLLRVSTRGGMSACQECRRHRLHEVILPTVLARRRAAGYKKLWEEYGTLYNPAWEEQEFIELREDLKAVDIYMPERLEKLPGVDYATLSVFGRGAEEDFYSAFDDVDYNLAETGQEWGLSGERTRQIEATALRKLRSPSRSEMLRDFLKCDDGEKVPRRAYTFAEWIRWQEARANAPKTFKPKPVEPEPEKDDEPEEEPAPKRARVTFQQATRALAPPPSPSLGTTAALNLLNKLKRRS